MRTITVVAIMSVLLMCGSVSQAGEYKIGPEDVLEIKFWQDPELSSAVRVRHDGMISLDVIGEVMASGRSLQQLQDEIVRRMSRVNKKVSQAVVRVIEYNYQHVFVTGQVNAPGKMTFEEIPDLLTIINEAGWTTELGDLTRVTIIRGGDRAGEVEVVDLAAAIANGTVDRLPGIRRQDAIEVPRSPVGIPPADIGRTREQRNVIYVIGAVRTPGPIRFEDNVDIMEALAFAGGPTDNANLRKARVITKDGYYAQTIQLDLEKYSRTGIPARYIMRKEDTFIIPAKRGGFWGTSLGTVATVMGVVTSAVLVYQVLKPDEDGN